MPASVQPPDRDIFIATGNRREETHYERDPDQMVRVAHLEKPQGPLPREESTVGAGLEPQKPGEPIQDVKVDPSEDSVWDGRPPEEDRSFAPRRLQAPFPPAELVSKRAGG